MRLNSVYKWFFILVLLGFAVYIYFHTRGEKAINFSLNNWDGKTITLDTLKGKAVVLTFSYAFCSVRCPVITARLSLLDELMKAPRNVVYLHVSVDPEMDTPERRKKYFKLYRIDPTKDSRWMFVSGGREELLRLWEFYGIEIKKVESKELPEGYYMEYTPKVVVIDKNGFIKYETDFYFLDDEIAEEIRGAV